MLGAFVTPEPHHLPVAAVGSGPEAKVFSRTVKDTAGGALDVRTVASRAEPSRSDAVDLLKSRDITGACVPSAKSPRRSSPPPRPNFTGSRGLFRTELHNGFFGTPHAFWNGAGFVEGVRRLLRFDRDGCPAAWAR
ncbi:hypothetical protein [Streptomyces sp. 142MFCol3.1]|uniref:hypothetical protein n=1 Tax=Streptomyces sp. 142MFCol3.1 TaxID=1172179 RepID=UPI00040ABC4E|nr:hypothetical protein [Streptomyces sp. 142MFCol3.1]